MTRPEPHSSLDTPTSDAPGRDTSLVTRPPTSVRLYSKSIDSLGSRLTIYQVSGGLAAMSAWFEEQRRRGLHEIPPSTFENRRVYQGPRGRAVVTVRTDPRTTIVTVVELFK